MGFDIYAGSHVQSGKSQNEDSFIVGRGTYPMAAIADGSGVAGKSAHRALGLFEKLHKEAESSPESLLDADTWKKWTRLLDSALLNGAQSTFIGLSFGDVLDKEGKKKTVVAGCAVGDSRCYLLSKEGKLHFVTAGANKKCLGSGQVEPYTSLIDPLKAGDILLLMTDGCAAMFDMARLQKAVVTAAVKHFSEVPTSILNAVGKSGQFIDDATVIAVRNR